MLKFFRKIRHQLLSENQTSKYLLYAIGEIFLVMIGILLALQVNNWNQARQDNLKEQKLLLALQDEFQHNLKSLEAIMEKNIRVNEGLKTFLRFSGPKYDAINKEQYYKLQYGIGAASVLWEPVVGVINDIQNSGQLNNLSDSALRRTLGTWKALLEKVAYQEGISEAHRERIKDIILIESNMTESSIFSGSAAANKIDFGKYQFDTDARKLLTNQALTNIVIMRTSTSGNQQRRYAQVKTEIETILKLIAQQNHQ